MHPNNRNDLHPNRHHPDRWVRGGRRSFFLPSRRSFRKWSNRGCKSTIPENPKRPFLPPLSLCLSPLVLLLCCETGEKLGVVEDARERIARFVTSIRGPKACCATLRRLPSSLGITVRVFSPPTGHRHGPSGVSIDRARPKLSPNRSIRCVPSWLFRLNAVHAARLAVGTERGRRWERESLEEMLDSITDGTIFFTCTWRKYFPLDFDDFHWGNKVGILIAIVFVERDFVTES